MKKNIFKFAIFFVCAFFLVCLDQWTKNLAKVYLINNELNIINDVLVLTYYENSGAAFGILQGKQSLFFIITIVVLLFILLYIYKMKLTKRFIPLFISILLIFSGAIGNMIDRVMNGKVVDFIYVKIINFPIFNVADSFITIGAFLLFFLILFKYKEEELKL